MSVSSLSGLRQVHWRSLKIPAGIHVKSNSLPPGVYHHPNTSNQTLLVNFPCTIKVSWQFWWCMQPLQPKLVLASSILSWWISWGCLAFYLFACFPFKHLLGEQTGHFLAVNFAGTDCKSWRSCRFQRPWAPNELLGADGDLPLPCPLFSTRCRGGEYLVQYDSTSAFDCGSCHNVISCGSVGPRIGDSFRRIEVRPCM